MQEYGLETKAEEEAENDEGFGDFDEPKVEEVLATPI
jgi:hypothetical protein